ncbi:MAG TPA: APC family permease, partial [Gaiellaceae bacterium]|nr:APC family permease [Gaiellaceae bacterium]
MEAATASGSRFEHLREHSIGLPQVLFQSITHMAPAAAVAYSIFISVPQSQQALPLSVGLALIACICAATAIGQLAKLFPSAGGMYTYAGKSLGPWAGFLVAWLFILFQPLVAPFLYLEFGWAMSDVFSNSIGWHYSGQWWIWVVLMTVIVFLLTYRDIRLSTTAGVILGAFEIAIFAALALWMMFSNAGDLNLQPFNPTHAAGDWSGVFKGMVFAILAFIGFEASAPLGEEARNPRRTVPRAVVGSAIAIGIFYVLCSYAWVFGAGFDGFVKQATGADPWRNLGKVFWGTGWVVVFLAICNSIAANSNAAVNAATRVFYALARNGLAPRSLGHVHKRFKTPTVAIVWMSAFALVLSLVVGWKWNPGVGFGIIATAAVPLVIVVYMLVCVGCMYWYSTKARASFNPLLHVVLPIG